MTNDTPQPSERDCKHGHLARSCEICALEMRADTAERALAECREALQRIPQIITEMDVKRLITKEAPPTARCELEILAVVRTALAATAASGDGEKSSGAESSDAGKPEHAAGSSDALTATPSPPAPDALTAARLAGVKAGIEAAVEIAWREMEYWDGIDNDKKSAVAFRISNAIRALDAAAIAGGAGEAEPSIQERTERAVFYTIKTLRPELSKEEVLLLTIASMNEAAERHAPHETPEAKGGTET